MRRLSLHNHGPRLLYRKVLVFLIRNPYKKCRFRKEPYQASFQSDLLFNVRTFASNGSFRTRCCCKTSFYTIICSTVENVDSLNKLKIECFMEICRIYNKNLVFHIGEMIYSMVDRVDIPWVDVFQEHNIPCHRLYETSTEHRSREAKER